MNIFDWIVDRPARLKAFLQRGWRGWADDDTWNYDAYLAKVISEGLAYLYTYKQGCPPNLYKKYNKKGIPQEIVDGRAHAEWDTILRKIILAFNLSRDLIYGNGWDIDEEDENDQKIDEGMKLFIKYYFNLWN
jgi:hypothetical protein